MSTFSRFTPLVGALPATVPFVGPEAIERQRGLKVRARIGANENGFGPAPSVLEAITAAAAETWKYNDPENFELKQALAAHHGIRPDNIAIGEGIDSLLGLIVRLVVEPGTTVVTSLGAYPTFNYHANGFGCRLVTVPYAGDREDLSGLLDAVGQEDATLVYFANPDNPMGSWREADEVLAFARAAARPAERHPHPHLLESLWSGRRAGRLRHRHARHDSGLRQDPPSFRHEPHRHGGSTGGAGRSGLPA